jgi:hypothetical protein
MHVRVIVVRLDVPGSVSYRRRAARAAGSLVSWLSKPAAARSVHSSSGCGSTVITMRTRGPSAIGTFVENACRLVRAPACVDVPPASALAPPA